MSTGVENKFTSYGGAISGQGVQKAAAPKNKAITAGKSSGATKKPTSTTPLGAKKYDSQGKKLPGTTPAKKPGVTGANSTAAKSLPKAYPNNVPYGSKVDPSKSKSSNSTGNKPKPYPNSNSYPGSKSAVKPGAPKPFNPGSDSKSEAKAYPGTNTLPGQGSNKPVKKYKAAERYKPQVKQGEKATFV